MILRCAVHRSGVPMRRLVVRTIIIGAAPMPTFQVGDIFRYKVGNTLVAESVERIDSDGVW